MAQCPDDFLRIQDTLMSRVTRITLGFRVAAALWILAAAWGNYVEAQQPADHGQHAITEARQGVQIETLDKQISDLKVKFEAAHVETLAEQVRELRESEGRTFSVLLLVCGGVAVNLFSGLPGVLLAWMQVKKK